MRAPRWLSGKESATSVGNAGSVPGLEIFSGGRNGGSLQYFCLENPRDRGAWRATVHRVAKESDMTEVTEHVAHI